MRQVKYFLFAFLMIGAASGFAMLANTQTMQARNFKLTVRGTLENEGEILGTESAKIRTDALTGDGLIKAPKVNITTKTFAYTGTIECEESCKIVVGEPFDENIFKKVGPGKFEIVVMRDMPRIVKQKFSQH